ncbi:MAG: HD domain-containing protein [Pseudomonadota bacterium]
MITRDDITKLFSKQLQKIHKVELREQVVAAWVEACAVGRKTSVDELMDMPFSLLVDCRGISFIEHCQAVTDGAWALFQAQRESYRAMPYAVDEDRLVAGGLLHDLGKLMELERGSDGKWTKSRNGKLLRHPISGAILAGRLGLDDAMLNIIACHAKEGDGAPKVVETILIKQADFATFDPLVMQEKGSLIA